MKTEIGPVKMEITEADYAAIQKISKIGIFQILSDQFGYWRQCNLVRISKKFKEKCEREGIDPKRVSPKFMAQFIEAASLDDEEGIQNMWVSLLARESQAPGSISLRTISSLKNLSKEEANDFQRLYVNAIRLGSSEIAIYNDRDGENKSIDDIIRLVDCGLIVSESTSITITAKISSEADGMIAQSPRNVYAIIAHNASDKEEKCVVPIFSLTRAGQDILNATNDNKTDDSFLHIAEKIKKNNSNLAIKLFKVKRIDKKNNSYSVYDDRDMLD